MSPTTNLFFSMSAFHCRNIKETRLTLNPWVAGTYRELSGQGTVQEMQCTIHHVPVGLHCVNYWNCSDCQWASFMWSNHQESSCKLLPTQWTLWTHCTHHTKHQTLYTSNRIMHIAHNPCHNKNQTLYIEHYPLHSSHYTLYTAQITLHNKNRILNKSNLFC